MPSKPRVDRIKICYTAAMHLNYGWRMSGYPCTPFNNAATKYIPQLHRITVRFCRKNECSSGVRHFISSGLLSQFASQNPSVVVYVQPIRNPIAPSIDGPVHLHATFGADYFVVATYFHTAPQTLSHVDFLEKASVISTLTKPSQNIPVLRAEYGNGRIIQIVLKNFDAEQVGRHLNLLRTRSGLPVVDLVSRQSAQVASVQGMWNPMLNINSELNISELSERKFSRHRTAELSATEYVSSLVDEKISDSR